MNHTVIPVDTKEKYYHYDYGENNCVNIHSLCNFTLYLKSSLGRCIPHMIEKYVKVAE